MIFQAIDCIQKQLDPIVHCVAANIGEILAGNANNNDADIVISLINIEEDRVSRDPRNYLKNGTDYFLKNPAIHLNLTLLFTATRSDTAYGPALQHLQQVILFFQGKYVFDHLNTPILDPGIEKLILEMLTYTMEELNHLWAINGSRYQPSVIYNVRMIAIDSVTEQQPGIVQEIQTNFEVEIN
jgi:hypothetical protein